MNDEVASIINLQQKEIAKSKFGAIQRNSLIVVKQKEIRNLFKRRKTKWLENKSNKKKKETINRMISYSLVKLKVQLILFDKANSKINKKLMILLFDKLIFIT